MNPKTARRDRMWMKRALFHMNELLVSGHCVPDAFDSTMHWLYPQIKGPLFGRVRTKLWNSVPESEREAMLWAAHAIGNRWATGQSVSVHSFGKARMMLDNDAHAYVAVIHPGQLEALQKMMTEKK